MNKNINSGLLILRLSLGIMMLLHGINKVFNGIDPLIGMMTDTGLPGFIAYGVYIGEVLAPIMLIIGFRTRLASVFIAATMLMAIFVAHSGDIFSLTSSGGWAIELQALYLFGSVSLFFTGAGKFAVSSDNTWD